MVTAMQIDIELPPQYHLEQADVSRPIKSSLDGSMQKCAVLFPGGYSRDKAVPLLVQLHSWGGNYQEKVHDVAAPAGKRGWIAVCVDYRGGNTNKMACASEFAIQDIVDAVHSMCDHYKIDKKKIYFS